MKIHTHTHTQFGYVLLGGKCVHLLAWVVTNLKEYIYVHVRTLTTCTFNNSIAIFALVTYVSGMHFNLDNCKWTIRDLGVYPYTSMYAGANTLQESLYPQHNIIV